MLEKAYRLFLYFILFYFVTNWSIFFINFVKKCWYDHFTSRWKVHKTFTTSDM